MAGHSKFKNIMHRKGAQDAKRSKMFAKLSKEISVAAKLGAPEPDMNPRLRLAIQAAKAQSMPKDNIERAIKKSLSNDMENFEEIRYEGFGPGGIGFIVEASTDNKNRAAMAVRTAFSKNGGALGETGSVAFMFDQIGKIEYPLAVTDEDGMMEAAIEAGAEDCESDDAADDQWDEYEPVHTIWTAREDLGAVAAELEKKFGEAKSVNLIWKGQNDIDNPEQAAAVVRLSDALEDCDDVSTVFHNFAMTEEAMATLEGEE